MPEAPAERCSAPIHRWSPQGATKSWYCTECGLIVFSPPTGEIVGRTPKRTVAPNGQAVIKNAPKGSAWLTKVLALIERDGLACFYCEHELLDPDTAKRFPQAKWRPTLDHLLPRSLGGRNSLDNLVLACSECNGRKGDHVRFLADVITRQRKQLTAARAEAERAEAFIDHLQWELFDAGLGEMPGRVKLTKKRKNRPAFSRPRGFRDIELYGELGERTCAHLRAENTGTFQGRTAAVVKRWQATERPRKNVLHVHAGHNPRGVW